MVWLPNRSALRTERHPNDHEDNPMTEPMTDRNDPMTDHEEHPMIERRTATRGNGPLVVSYPDENTPSNGCNVSGTVGESVNDTPDCDTLFCGDRRGSE